MKAPASLRRTICAVGAACLCAGFAMPSAAGDGAMTVAQNPPNPTPPPAAQGEEDKGKEHKKDHGEKGQQKGQQAAPVSPSAPPGNGKPGPQGAEPHERHQSRHPVEQPPVQQPVQVPPAPPPAPKVTPSTTPQGVPQQVIPQQAMPGAKPEHQRKHRDQEEKKVSQPPATPPAAPNAPPNVAPPAEKKTPSFSTLPKGPVSPAPGKQVTPSATPLAPVPGLPPGKPATPQGSPPAPAATPSYGAIPAPGPTNTQAAPDTGFKRRSTQGPTQPTPGAPPQRVVLPAAPAPQSAQPNLTPKFAPGFQPAGPSAHRLQDVQKSRTQRTDEGGKRMIIEEPDNRVIVKQDNRAFVRHDETGRLAVRAEKVHSQRRPDGMTETIIVRPGGVQVFNVVDGSGRLVRRYRRDDRGREINIIDNRRFYEGAAAGIAIAAGIGIAADVLGLHLGPPRIGIPRERYIVDYDRASDDDLYEALTAPPVDRLDRAYSLEEIRYNVDLRDRMRRIDLDTINFDFGAWDVSPRYYDVLARIAAGMNRAIDRNPGEVFLIEGYTDAVGSEIDNLSLSDRRAQSVAEILTEDFDVPPENIVTQGYGEEYLKIPTPGPERANRRVAVRRITPLLAQDEYR
jgi:outer membrane protein OmpA-like peptidoglycan-associated protein